MKTDLTEHTTPEQRMTALQREMTDSAEAMARAARIYVAMETAGDDVSSVPPMLRKMLRRVASNLMLPEVLVKMSGVLRLKVASLPIAEQQRMLDPGTVLDVVTPAGDTVVLSPQRMTPAQLRQVFGEGYIRERGEQMAVMGITKAVKPAGAMAAKVVVDRANKVVVFHGRIISAVTLRKWLEEMNAKIQ